MDTLRAPTAHVELPNSTPPTLGHGESWRPTRRAMPPPGPEPPPPLEESVDTLVLVATLDRASIRGLTRRLLGRANVRSVRGEFELVYAVESHPGTRPVVVIDCCVPSMDAETVATMVGALPRIPLVVLWGASADTLAELRRIAPAARSWVRLGPSATDADVAQLLDSLAYRRPRRKSGRQEVPKVDLASD
jgi:hypothetical protein